MSNSKKLKRTRRLVIPVPLKQTVPALPAASPSANVGPTEPARGGFSMTLVFYPNKPNQVRYDVLASGEATPLDGDILNVLMLARDDILIKSAIGVAQQQMKAQAQEQPPAPIPPEPAPRGPI